jgi:2,4-diketo-3-deoxy-L-fuconate hydrolase
MRQAVHFVGPNGAAHIGRLEGDTVIDAGAAGPRGFDASPEAWNAVEGATGPRYALADVRLLAPSRPDAVLCVGLNYTDHIAESGVATPEYPMIFVKLSSSIIGQGDEIVLPADEPQPDWEAEMGIMIGSTARRVRGADARAAIGGITIVNDVSGRYAQLTTGGGQFVRGKSYDTFCPIGPSVVHPDDVDFANLDISLRVNGETMQDSNTKYLLFDSIAIVEWLSAVATLRPGDVIATGTPGGVGQSMKPTARYLAPGDVVEVELQHVGVLRNPVVAERPGA